MDYETIGEVKYFLSDKEALIRDGFDQKNELKRLEQYIMRKKNSFMIADSQFNLLTALGFVRVDGYHPSETLASFMEKFQLLSNADFSYVRTRNNKKVELFFKNFELSSDGHDFYYVSMKTFQDNPLTLGNGKQNFFYSYDEIYNAEPNYLFKYVDDFIEKINMLPYYNSYARIIKTYYPNNPDKEFDFYLSMVAFNSQKAPTILDYTLYKKRISFYNIKKLLPDLEYTMDSLSKRKTFIDEGHIELLKIILYS